MHLTKIAVIATLTLSAVGILFPSSVRAENDTCGNAEYIFPGEVRSELINRGTSKHFKTEVVAGRSYSLTSWAPFEDEGEGPVHIANLFFLNDTCTTPAATSSGNDSEPELELSGLFQGDHDSLIPTISGTIWIRIANTNGLNDYTVHTRLLETTLFSPWWFTGGTNQAFVEIRNTTNTTTDYTATFVLSDGSTCGTVSGSLPANGNTALRVNDLPACSGTSGSAQIALQGQANALVANITTIDGVQATSFDAPFRPRMEWGSWNQ